MEKEDSKRNFGQVDDTCLAWHQYHTKFITVRLNHCNMQQYWAFSHGLANVIKPDVHNDKNFLRRNKSTTRLQ